MDIAWTLDALAAEIGATATEPARMLLDLPALPSGPTTIDNAPDAAVNGDYADAVELMEAMAESPLDSTQTLQTQRAFNKLLWIQNDFITRHYQAGVPVNGH